MAGFASLPNRRVTAYRGRYVHIDWEMDRAGIRKIAVSRPLRDVTTEVVRDRALPYAKSISPYDPDSGGPHYRDSFRVTQGYETIQGLRRVATRLHNVAPHSTVVEWKNGSRVLGRTLAFLNHESILAEVAREARVEEMRKRRRVLFESSAHPRDARGRFVRRR